MDPDTALTLLRQQIDFCLDQDQDQENPTREWAEAAREALQTARDLDHWLTRGGFPPTPWTPRAPVPRPPRPR